MPQHHPRRPLIFLFPLLPPPYERHPYHDHYAHHPPNLVSPLHLLSLPFALLPFPRSLHPPLPPFAFTSHPFIFPPLTTIFMKTNSIQRPPNISIKIDTTKEFATDSDQGHDTEKPESALVSACYVLICTSCSDNKLKHVICIFSALAFFFFFFWSSLNDRWRLVRRQLFDICNV